MTEAEKKYIAFLEKMTKSSQESETEAMEMVIKLGKLAFKYKELYERLLREVGQS